MMTASVIPSVSPATGVFPGFSAELCGTGEANAAFLGENRARGRFQRSVQEIRVSRSPVGLLFA